MDLGRAVDRAAAAGPHIWTRVLVGAGLRRTSTPAELTSAVERFSAVRLAFLDVADRELWSAHRRPDPDFRMLAGLPADHPGPRAQDVIPVYPAPPESEPWSSLDRALRDASPEPRCIVGPAGAGKTSALAWHLARRPLGRGVIWLDARAPDPVPAWAAWFSALFAPMETSAPDRARRVRRHCEELGVLVVLDGVDPHDKAGWLRHLPQCPVLATARVPLPGFATMSLEPPASENTAARAVMDEAALRDAAGAAAERLQRTDGRAHDLALTLAAKALLAGANRAAIQRWSWSGIDSGASAPETLAEFVEARTPASAVLDQLARVLADDPGRLPYRVQWRILVAGSRFLELPEDTRLRWLRLGIDYALSDLQAEHPAGALTTLRLLASTPRGTAPEDALVRYHTGRTLLTLASYEEALVELGAAALQVTEMPQTDGRVSLVARALTQRARCFEMLGATEDANREQRAADALVGALP